MRKAAFMKIMVVIVTVVLDIPAAHATSKIAFRLGADNWTYFRDNPGEYNRCHNLTSYMHFDGVPTAEKRGLFFTNTALIEKGMYTAGGSYTGTDVVDRIQQYEDNGWSVYGVFLYREDWHAVGGTGGPFLVDRRILSQSDIDAVKSAISNSALNCKGTVKLFQLLGARVGGQKGDSWFQMDDAHKAYLQQFDGIGTECHVGDYINTVNYPDGTQTLKAMAQISRWCLNRGKTPFIFMGGGPLTYTNLPSCMSTYNLLWNEMDKYSIAQDDSRLVYFRQGAHDSPEASFIPEDYASPTTLTTTIKWLIEQVGM